MTKKFYVTMTDKHMSGWGLASNKISKLVVECDTLEQAELIHQNVKRKSKEMKYVNITISKPSYNSNQYHTSIKNFDSCAYWNK